MTDSWKWFRIGVRSIITQALRKGGVGDDVKRKKVSTELEKACFSVCKGAKPEYVKLYGSLCKVLPKKTGAFLDATLAVKVARGDVAVEEAIDPSVHEEMQKKDPRKVCRALFYEILAQDTRFDSDNDQKRREYATSIERGCYNAALERCDTSPDSYRRQWTSEMFVNVYSAYCGRVSSNIDPRGLVMKRVEGGSWALDCLAEGKWQPEDLGAMTATQLCPMAGKKERDEIMHRQNQKVEEKTSSLFACPRCHKRNHTYRQVQIGAGDEPSTFMCTCKECGENYQGYA
jgi:DNA-directed RNA polymerase subunit M/transcription elongation factor TFIIS